MDIVFFKDTPVFFDLSFQNIIKQTTSSDEPEEQDDSNTQKENASSLFWEQQWLIFVFEWIFPLLACIAHESESPIPEGTSGHSNVRISTSTHVTS